MAVADPAPTQAPVAAALASTSAGNGSRELSSTLSTSRAPAPTLVVGVAFVVFAARFLGFTHRYAANVLFWDHWAFLTPLFDGEGLWRIFRWRHGAHRQGLGGLTLAAVYRWTDWDGKAEALACAALIVAGTLLAIGLKKRLVGQFSVLDAFIPMLALTLAQYEAVAGTTNPAHGPWMLPLATCAGFACLVGPPWLRATLLVLLHFLAAHTGFSIFLSLCISGLLALEITRTGTSADTRRWNIAALALSGVSFLVFFHGYVLDPYGHPESPAVDPLRFAAFSGLVLLRPFVVFEPGEVSSALEWLAAGVLGAAIFFVLFTVRMVFRSESKLWRVVLLFAGTALLFVLDAAVGRMWLGYAGAKASRYVTYTVLFWIGLYYALASAKSLAARVSSIVLIAAATFSATHQSAAFLEAQHYLDWKTNWSRCYLKEHNTGACDARFPALFVRGSAELQPKLDYLEQHHLNFFKDAGRP